MLIVPYLMGGMGAGDAKLMGAVGAILGAKGVFIAFLFTAIAGGIYAVILLGLNPKYLRLLFSRLRTFFATLLLRYGINIRTSAVDEPGIPAADAGDKNKPKLCYGLAIAVGTLCYLISEWAGYPLISW